MNKKIYSLLIIVFGLILLPFNAFAKDVVKPETYEDKAADVWVLEKSGIKLYADSSATIDNEIGVTIPKNGHASARARKQTEDGIWIYVEYEGKDGWILAVKNGQSAYLAIEDVREGLEVANTVDLYEYPTDGSKVVGKVTYKDSIKTSYSYGVWLVWYYVEVDGTKGWIKGQDSFIEKQETQVVLLNDAYVYDEPDGKKTGAKVSKDKILTLSSIKNTVKDNKTLVYGLYNDNGKNVWILISSDNTNYATKLATDNFENEIATIVDGDKIYKSANSKAEVVGTISAETKITEAYKFKDNEGNDSYYVVSDAGNGWVLKAFYDYKDEETPDKPVNPSKPDGFSALAVGIFVFVLGAIALGVVLLILKKQKKVKDTE